MPGRILEAVQRVRGPGGQAVHLGRLGHGQLAGADRQLGVRDGLAVPVRGRRLAGGRRAVPGHRGRVADRDRVVHEPGRLGALRGERLEHPPVQRGPPGAGQRLLDRPAGQLVPEPHRPVRGQQDAAPLGRLQRGRVLDQLRQQRGRHLGRHDGQPLHGLPAARRQRGDPGQHRVPDRRRHLAAGRGEHLGDQERVAGRGGGHRRRVDAGLGRQHRDRGVGQPRQLQPDDRRRGETADDPPERVVRAQLLLAVGDHQQRRQLRHPPGQRLQHVQGRLVGPVRVLDHDDRGPLGEAHLGQQRVEQRVPLARSDAERDAGQLPDHVPERAERPGGDQVLAGAAEQPGVPGGPVRELGQQAGLADPGLAGDQHDAAPAPPRPLQGGAESVEVGVALQQPHDPSAEQSAAPRVNADSPRSR